MPSFDSERSARRRRLRNSILAGLVTVVALAIVAAPDAQVTVPFPNFVIGNIADPAQVNANFSALSNLALNRTGGTMSGTLTSQTIAPAVDATYTLGDGAHRYTTGSFSGTLTAGTFSGSGASLTSIPAATALSGRIGMLTDYWPAYGSHAGNYTVLTTDDDLDCDASGGASTVTLPTPVGVSGKTYNVKKTDSSVNACTVATAAGNIDGSATFAISAQFQNMTFRSNNTNWEIR